MRTPIVASTTPILGEYGIAVEYCTSFGWSGKASTRPVRGQTIVATEKVTMGAHPNIAHFIPSPLIPTAIMLPRPAPMETSVSFGFAGP